MYFGMTFAISRGLVKEKLFNTTIFTVLVVLAIHS